MAVELGTTLLCLFLSQPHDSSSRPEVSSDKNEKNTFLLAVALTKVEAYSWNKVAFMFCSLRPQLHHTGLNI